MKRELKFKAWNTETNTMTGTHGLNNYGLYQGENFPFGEDKITSGRLIPLQYSGITDKENTEIYELDICEFYKDKEEPLFFHGIAMMNNNVVGGEWKIIRCDNVEENPQIKGVDCLDSSSFWNENFKKIGSAYENPELLK